MQHLVNSLFECIKITNRLKDSLCLAFYLLGIASSAITIIGTSPACWTKLSLSSRLGMLIVIYFLLSFFIYLIKGCKAQDKIKLTINHTQVIIRRADIFKTINCHRVIACDSHFSTKVDDIVIAKKSLHGKFILEHCSKEELRQTIRDEAERLKLSLDHKNNHYNFKLGTIIKYKSTKDKETYLLLALANLDQDNKARTNKVEYLNTLIAMWKEVSRLYANQDIALPLIGSGILRFDDYIQDDKAILKLILLALSISGVRLSSTINILLYNNAHTDGLYEYKKIINLN